MKNTDTIKKTSTKELEAKAEKGDVQAQASLGLLYELGIDVPKADPKEAAKWWGKAAKSGDGVAQFSLSEIISKNFEDSDENKAMAAALYKKAEQAGQVRADKAVRILGKESGAGTKILIVDGDQETKSGVKEFLETEGFAVHVAPSIKDGLAYLKSNFETRMVFTDIHFNGVEDFGMIKSIRNSKDFATMPVVVVAKDNTPAAVMTGKKLGVMGWIVKPANVASLRRYLEKAGIGSSTRIERAS